MVRLKKTTRALLKRAKLNKVGHAGLKGERNLRAAKLRLIRKTGRSF